MKTQLANVHVPPVVLLPTPPATAAPKAKQPEVELQAKLQLPPPINPLKAFTRLAHPPPIVLPKPWAVLIYPPLTVDPPGS